MKRFFSAFVSAVMAAAIISPLSVISETVNIDINSDGKINVFDWILQKREDASSEKLLLIRDFLHGKSVNLENNSYPVDESAILEPKGTVHYGEGTYYDGGYVGGCAMLDPVSTDIWVAAMNITDYNNAQLAGAYIEVTGELGSIKMLVTDLLPEGKKGDVDLCEDAFPLIAPVEKGRVDISWKIIPLDTAEDAPVSYKFKEGSSPYWCGVQVRNHRYPVSKLEYMNENGEFIELERKQYNFFESDEMGAGPFTFRVTDIYGQVIVDENIPMAVDGISQGKSQFPL
ncbi:MAG: hypothetical protein E7508_06200 [Ruminococcus sp.]|nr:hypothetical protein [Ruminococcus sp.]